MGDTKETAVHRLKTLRDLLSQVHILDFDLRLAEYTGNLRAALMDDGKNVPDSDLFIAATTLFHNFTLVTHNVSDYLPIPNLRVDDWLK